MSLQQRKKVPHKNHRNNNQNRGSNSHNNRNSNNNNHNNSSNNNNNYNKNNSNNDNYNSINESQGPKPPPSFLNAAEYPRGAVYGSLDYPLPELLQKPSTPHKFNDIPNFTFRQPAVLIESPTLLNSTYAETMVGESDPARNGDDTSDIAIQMVRSKRYFAKKFKLGDITIDINKKPNLLASNGSSSNKLVNKFLQKDSLSTPLKRNRDEVVDVSSSIKKNKRLQDIQQDTTMELSFEGKAMDKNDYVKLVDSSGIMADDTNNPNDNNANQNSTFDTKNLLQNTEFSFQFKK